MFPYGITRALIPGWVPPEKWGGGVLPASQKPYSIYDQNLRFSLPYLWPDQKFDTLFMAFAAGIIYEGLLLIVLPIRSIERTDQLVTSQ